MQHRTTARARAWIARGLRRRPPFWLALVFVVAGFTALTGTTIGILAWWENRATSRALLETAMAQTARLATDQAEEFLRSAEATARLGAELVRAGALDPDDDRQLERFVLATLRATPGVTWVSYGGADDRFMGAWRDAGGAVHINHSFPVGARIRLIEDAVAADGTRTPTRRSEDHGYRPTERPFFRLAAGARHLVWTDPYEFWPDKTLGVTCAVPLLDASGNVRGVFTADFSLARLSTLVERLEVSPRGHVFIADREGRPMIAPRAAGAPELLARPSQELMREVVGNLAPGTGRFTFERDGVPYLGHVERMHVGDLSWLVEVIVPEADYTTSVNASARRTVLLGLVAIALAVGGGIATARWVARPLRVLAEAARRIRRGNLSVPPLPATRDEIGVLGRAMADMVTALRDREFVRGVLGRFVSPELAERVLKDRQALRLGGELRDVTVLFSDLRGFSELSEHLGAEAVIQLVNRYLAVITPVILAHHGTIVDFLGDGIFVMFGAPFAREDAAAQALRCAWAMQQAMEDVNLESRKLGIPEIAMGIAVHSGRAVVGNIGSDDRVKYGVVGPPVNLAAHLQAHARAGEVLLTTAAVARGAAIAFVDEPREVELKGRATPLMVYPLAGLAKG